MTKENIKKNRIDLKVAVFWVLILAVTILFAVLFAMRIHDTRIFDSYDDLKSAKFNKNYILNLLIYNNSALKNVTILSKKLKFFQKYYLNFFEFLLRIF